MFEEFYLEENKKVRKQCYTAINAEICSYQSQKITSEYDFINTVPLYYSWFFTNYDSKSYCLRAIETLGFGLCKDIKAFWMEQVQDMGFILVKKNNSIWDTKSFNAHKCLVPFNLSNTEICYKKTGLNTNYKKHINDTTIFAELFPWNIQMPYENQNNNTLELCMKEFETNGFVNCTISINDTQPAGSIHDDERTEL